MKELKISVTMKDIQRYRILKDVVDRKIKAIQASTILGLSYIHTLRLIEKVAQFGLKGLLRPVREAHNKIPTKQAKRIVTLYKTYYGDFNIMHFKDKLTEMHNISLSYESIRQILILENIHMPKKKKVVHRQRRRMPKAGMLVQMDSSQHLWLEHIPVKWWLIALIDDATNEVPYAQFVPKDNLFANMYVLRRVIELKGLFHALYVDKASHFTTTRHGGLHYSVTPEPDETQIQRALNELDITLIPANSPQAKGRIEVLFRLFQDRLIKEMRLVGIKNYNQANSFLQSKFLPWYNAKYHLNNVESAYFPLPKNKKLDTVFCIKKERTVNGDNTIQFQRQIIQIPPSHIHLSFAKRKVDLCLLDDNRLFILYKGTIICETRLEKTNKECVHSKKIEKILNLREYISPSRKKYVPPPNHPWRKFSLKYYSRRSIANNINNSR